MLKILPALAWLWAAVAAPGADAPATFKVGEFTFTRPAGWEWSGVTSAVYKAKLQLGVPTRMESAQVFFIHEAPRPGHGAKKSNEVELGLPPAEPLPGGRPRSKADREWAEIVARKSELLPTGQQPNAMGFRHRYRMEETNVAGHKVTFVNMRPVSEVGMARPFEVHRNVGHQIFAFVESKEGNVFIKFIGHVDLLDASQAEFRKMIESAAAGK